MLTYRWRQLKNFGLSVKCPICRSFLSGYVKHGQHFEVLHIRNVVGGIALKDRCPVCYGISRTRLIAMYLEPLLNAASSPLKILHFAPELGLANWIRQYLAVRYTACDATPFAYQEIPNVLHVSLPYLPFADNSFDVIVCSHVLEHVTDDRAAMREIFRILDAKGTALFMVPEATDGLGTDEEPSLLDPDTRERRFGQNDHVRLYGRDDFVDRLSSAGFDTCAFHPFEEFPNKALSMHLNPQEILRVAIRPRQDSAALSRHFLDEDQRRSE
jgi:SAM-dependent methyltransferase